MRIHKLFSGLFMIFMSIILIMLFVEIGAQYYLWNIAPEEKFDFYASVSELRGKYGEDFLIIDPIDNKSTNVVPHPYLGYVTRPDWENDDGDNRHNTLGYRGDEFSYDKPEGVYRIVAIGDSTTYGTGVGYNETYPYRLQEYLNQNGYNNVEVVNAGVPAYTSYESMINLQFRVLDLDPDLIILYEANTDVHARLVWPQENYIGDNTGFRAPFIQDVVMPNFWEYSDALRIFALEMGWIESHSDLDWIRWRRTRYVVGDEYREQYESGTYPSGIFEDVSAMEILEANPPIYFERNIRNMAAIAQANDVEMLYITFVVSSKFDLADTTSDVYLKGIGEHNDIIRRVANETGSYLFDLAPVFPDVEENFIDGYHFSPLGTKIYAQVIGDYIIDSIIANVAFG